jgi:hypothetical protein
MNQFYMEMTHSHVAMGRRAYFALAWQTNTGLLGVFSEVMERLAP